MSNVVPIKAPIRLHCSKCGVTQEAPCDCGAPYVPARILAQQAVIQFPDKSDRAIAAELGIGKDTVRRARESAGASAPVETEARTGTDGKQRVHRPRSKLSPRVRAIARKSPQTDGNDGRNYLTTSEADEAIGYIARCVDRGLFAPSPGILVCLKEAMARASAKERATLAAAGGSCGRRQS